MKTERLPNWEIRRRKRRRSDAVFVDALRQFLGFEPLQVVNNQRAQLRRKPAGTQEDRTTGSESGA